MNSTHFIKCEIIIIVNLTHTVPSGTPGGLKISHCRPTSVQLSWTPVPEDRQNGIITGYTIEVVRPDFTRMIQVKDATTTSAEVSGLQPSTSYYFSISAMTVDGTGPAARIFSITPQAQLTMHGMI